MSTPGLEVWTAAQERAELDYVEDPKTGLIGLVPSEQLDEWQHVLAKATAYDALMERMASGAL